MGGFQQNLSELLSDARTLIRQVRSSFGRVELLKRFSVVGTVLANDALPALLDWGDGEAIAKALVPRLLLGAVGRRRCRRRPLRSSASDESVRHSCSRGHMVVRLSGTVSGAQCAGVGGGAGGKGEVSEAGGARGGI